MKTTWTIAFLLLLAGNLAAQSPRFLTQSFTPKASEGFSILKPTFSSPEKHFNAPSVLPGFARENPTGYSWFCRQELLLEKKLPVGVWIKIDEDMTVEDGPVNRASLRLKLLKF
ncbi:MAG: hypothetical protein H6581_10425 [Bacteroidia bacterium]|nr:hypothetical protein [Bacteroidia bacterium]